MIKHIPLLLIVGVLFAFVACSKEDANEVTPKEYSSPSYDKGYLLIKISDVPTIIDSIKYTNYTTGVSTLLYDQMVYYQFSNTSVFSKALATGHSGDQVQCCVYLNTPTNIGIRFADMPIDSVSTVFVNASSFCAGGTY
ncbi:MAG: hypothetical protein KDD41_04910 [Flavobacteriales bacterium]|nr:hypothetical protein [Flavobacteriales bacterium]